MTLLIIFAVLALLIFINALYVAAEFSTVSTRKPRLSQLITQGNKIAGNMLEIVEDPHKLDTYIATCQLGITVSSLLLGFYGQAQLSEYVSPLFQSWGNMSEIAAQSISATAILLTLTVFQVVLGELVPKNIGIQYPERLAILTNRPMRWSMTLFKPLIWLFNGSGQLIMKLLGHEAIAEHTHIHTPDEIIMLVEDNSKGIEKEERTLLKNTLQLRESKVREVMIPRNQMLAASIDQNHEQLFRTLSASPHSRMPLYNGTLDKIEGVVHIKDLLCLQDRADLTSIIREVPYLPETAQVKTVIHKLQKRHLQVAIVVDEYGGTAGMVTLEDLVEEIFGELQDEYDTETPNIRELPKNHLWVRGDTLIMDLNELLHTDLPSNDMDTIGGLILNQFSEVSEKNRETTVQGIPFTITKLDGHRVAAVIMQCTPEQIQNYRKRGQS